MKKHVPFILITFLFLGTSYWLGNIIAHAGKEYKSYKQINTDILNFEDRLLNAKEWIMPAWEWKAKKEKSENALRAADDSQAKAVTHAYYIVLLALFYLLICFFLHYKHHDFLRLSALSFTMVAFVFLWLGLVSPMMEIGAFSENLTIPLQFTVPVWGKEIDMSREFSGRMYYYYQNKSIMDLIHILFSGGNLLVGSCILFFSVINPVLKLAFSILVIIFPKLISNSFFRLFVYILGKFSMADVFVVAAFLAYLSFKNMNTGIDMEADTLPGLYFFTGFVLISIVGSIFIQLAYDRQVKKLVTPY